MATFNRPVPFAGTPEQRAANVMSHRWYSESDGEVYCDECCCKPWHTTAAYPCGAEVPRETIEMGVTNA